MPRKHEQSVSSCPTMETGLQVETVLPRPARGRRQVDAPSRRVEQVAPRLPRVTLLMALAIKLQDMVDRGEVRDYADLARLGYVTRARLTQIMNLLLLAPDIQETILFLTSAPNCTQPAERDLRSLCSEVLWETQRRKSPLNPGPTRHPVLF